MRRRHSCVVVANRSGSSACSASANLPGCRARTSSQAARAQNPIAGEVAFLLFGLGIVGTGMLAVPVLADCAAYAMADTFRWRNGLKSQNSSLELSLYRP